MTYMYALLFIMHLGKGGGTKRERKSDREVGREGGREEGEKEEGTKGVSE